MKLAPVVLFVYNRPKHTLKTLQALTKNDLSQESTLYIFADGPKKDASPFDIESIQQTRTIVRQKKWCSEVVIIESPDNKGLAKSIEEGVTKIVNKHGKIIVLEDDIITSKGFLRYMNDGLDAYNDIDQVMSVSSYIYPVKNSASLPNTFFYNANTCWGWGTWKRAWNYYENNPKILAEKLTTKECDWKDFNKGQLNLFHEQLIDNLEGRLKTWAVKWHASIYLYEGFVLHPGKSLVKNIGRDGSGTNFKSKQSLKDTDEFNENFFVPVERIELKESYQYREALNKYFLDLKRKKNIMQRFSLYFQIRGKILSLLNNN